MTDREEEHPRGESASHPPREIPDADLPPAREAVWTALKVFGIMILLFVGVSAWGTCFWWIRETTPPREWKHDAIVLEGEFRPDGSCTMRMDGEPLWPADTLRTGFDAMSIHGAAPEEYEVPQVTCAPLPRLGYFFVWGPVESGTPVRPGRYRITTDALPEGDTTAWEATLFHPAFDDQKAYLSGYKGYVHFTRADSTAVAGSFRVVARRTLRGPF